MSPFDRVVAEGGEGVPRMSSAQYGSGGTGQLRFNTIERVAHPFETTVIVAGVSPRDEWSTPCLNLTMTRASEILVV